MLLLAVMAGGSSCSFVAEADRLEYDYDDGRMERRLVMAVPQGYLSEQHEQLEGGYFTRTFRYQDGSSFFVACKEKPGSGVPAIEKTPDVMKELIRKMGGEGSGTSPEGKHWSRKLKDGFVVGFNDVDPKRLETFSNSMHSLRCRK